MLSRRFANTRHKSPDFSPAACVNNNGMESTIFAGAPEALRMQQLTTWIQIKWSTVLS